MTCPAGGSASSWSLHSSACAAQGQSVNALTPGDSRWLGTPLAPPVTDPARLHVGCDSSQVRPLTDRRCSSEPTGGLRGPLIPAASGQCHHGPPLLLPQGGGTQRPQAVLTAPLPGLSVGRTGQSFHSVSSRYRQGAVTVNCSDRGPSPQPLPHGTHFFFKKKKVQFLIQTLSLPFLLKFFDLHLF